MECLEPIIKVRWSKHQLRIIVLRKSSLRTQNRLTKV